MYWSLGLIVCSQLLFTITDLMARKYMHEYGFTLQTFISWWFLLYFLIKTIAMFGFLYVMATIDLGKTIALFSSLSIVLSNVLGILVLQEILTVPEYIGVSFAVAAFLILAVA